jgi:hypothetical protein
MGTRKGALVRDTKSPPVTVASGSLASSLYGLTFIAAELSLRLVSREQMRALTCCGCFDRHCSEVTYPSAKRPRLALTFGSVALRKSRAQQTRS